jgi:hypothetical protein
MGRRTLSPFSFFALNWKNLPKRPGKFPNLTIFAAEEKGWKLHPTFSFL